MNVVPFQLKHLDMIDMSKTNPNPVNAININKEYIICGKTIFDEDKVIGIGMVSINGMIATAHLLITDKIRRIPVFFIKAIKSFLQETINEGYTIIAAAHTEIENKFMIYLGFKETGKFYNNGNQITRYRYGITSIS